MKSTTLLRTSKIAVGKAEAQSCRKPEVVYAGDISMFTTLRRNPRAGKGLCLYVANSRTLFPGLTLDRYRAM